MYAICVCKLVNETVFPVQELSTKLAEHFVFLSVKPQPFVFILPCLLELMFSFGQRCFQMLCKFLYHLMIAFLFFFWNVCLWDSLFVSRSLALFGTIQKKKKYTYRYFSESDNFTYPEDQWGRKLLILDEWMSVKFDHWLGDILLNFPFHT